MHKLEDVNGLQLIDGWLYYVVGDLSNLRIYQVRKVKPQGTEEQILCSIEMAEGGYIYLTKESVEWYDTATETTNSMPLSDLRDVRSN